MATQSQGPQSIDPAMAELLAPTGQGDRESTVVYYRFVLEATWVAMERLLGPLGAASILQYSLRTASDQYPELRSLIAGESGLDPALLESWLLQGEPARLCEGLGALCLQLFRVLTELTGGVVVKPLMTKIRERRLDEHGGPGVE